MRGVNAERVEHGVSLMRAIRYLDLMDITSTYLLS